jgi:hypothetical protein
MFSGPSTCNSKPRARASKRLNTGVSSKSGKPVSGHFLESRVSNIHPTMPINTAIHPVKPRTTMGRPLLSHLRSTSNTKERQWSVALLRLKTATSPKLVLIMRWRTSSKLNTTTVTIMREPPLTNQRRTKTTKRKSWIVHPFQL